MRLDMENKELNAMGMKEGNGDAVKSKQGGYQYKRPMYGGILKDLRDASLRRNARMDEKSDNYGATAPPVPPVGYFDDYDNDDFDLRPPIETASGKYEYKPPTEKASDKCGCKRDGQSACDDSSGGSGIKPPVGGSSGPSDNFGWSSCVPMSLQKAVIYICSTIAICTLVLCYSMSCQSKMLVMMFDTASKRSQYSGAITHAGNAKILHEINQKLQKIPCSGNADYDLPLKKPVCFGDDCVSESGNPDARGMRMGSIFDGPKQGVVVPQELKGLRQQQPDRPQGAPAVPCNDGSVKKFLIKNDQGQLILVTVAEKDGNFVFSFDTVEAE